MVTKIFRKFLNVIFVTSVVSLAIAYISVLIPMIPDLTFLESVAIYTFLIHIASFLNDLLNNSIEEES